jgi:hypothetical protein
MTHLEQLAGDLRFVRGALASSAPAKSPAALYFFWAAAVLIGFALVDFRQPLVGPYWLVIGPLGFIVSALLGFRHAGRNGQLSAADCRRQLLHWGGMLLAIALAALMPGRGLVPWESLNAVILLIVALGYFTAGVHGERPFLWVGALMGAGYVVVMLGTAYAWTIVGVTLAIALTVAGLRGGRPLEAAP